MRKFIYRQALRIQYLTSFSGFGKLVAAINQRERRVEVFRRKFKVKGCETLFDSGRHRFVLQNIDAFLDLNSSDEGFFHADGNSQLYFESKSGIRLMVNNDEELFILHEIFFQKCYNVLVPDHRISIIDIGMNVGFATLYFAAMKNVASVFAFEPFSPTFQQGLGNIELNPSLKRKAFLRNYGLSDKTGSLKINYSNKRKGKNSVHNYSIVPGAEEVEIQLREARKEITTICDACKDMPVYIKMDCEGSEFEIFDTFHGHRLPDNLKGFIVEWHFKSPSQIERYLIGEKFKLVNTVININSGLLYAFR